METLEALKEKISQLIAKIHDVTKKNDHLLQENDELMQRLNSVETALLNNNQNIDELTQEKTRTKHIVDDLIKSIDSLMSDQR